jgi:hypothetical protein
MSMYQIEVTILCKLNGLQSLCQYNQTRRTFKRARRYASSFYFLRHRLNPTNFGFLNPKAGRPDLESRVCLLLFK